MEEKDLRSLSDKAFDLVEKQISKDNDDIETKILNLSKRVDYVLHRDPKLNKSKLKKLIREKEKVFAERDKIKQLLEAVTEEKSIRNFKTTAWWNSGTTMGPSKNTKNKPSPSIRWRKREPVKCI